jgi:hypothetical protein
MKLSSRKELLKEASTMLKSLRESTKKSLNEVKGFSIIDRIDQWELSGINRLSDFNISKDWARIMEKRPSSLSEEELQLAIRDCESNIEYANTLITISNNIKDQLQGYTSSASSISAGEKFLSGKQITSQHIADFLESIFITDKGNLKKIFDMYNASVKKQYSKDRISNFDLLLKKPSDLNGIPRIRQGGKDIVFLYTRADGGNLSEWAINDSIFKLLGEEYPEVAPLLMIRNRGYYSSIKKNFTISVVKSTISSRPATNKSWTRIFAKYAEWLQD